MLSDNDAMRMLLCVFVSINAPTCEAVIRNHANKCKCRLDEAKNSITDGLEQPNEVHIFLRRSNTDAGICTFEGWVMLVSFILCDMSSMYACVHVFRWYSGIVCEG